jgi:putative DNA primase/helicase
MSALCTDIELEEAADSVGTGHFNNDVGYADSFIAKYGDGIRFIAGEETWLIFDKEKGWHRDTSREIEGLAAEFARGLYHAALEEAKTLPPKEAAPRITSVSRLGDKRRITPALQLASANRSIVVSPADLDMDTHLLGTRNGVVDLRDRSFHPHSTERMVTRSVACDYDPEASCPTFLNFLEKVQPDPEVRAFLQRLCGYALTGNNGEHILPFHYGVGANGKGTFLEQTIFKLMGSYACKLTDSLVYANPRGKENNLLEIAGLCGIRFALGEENADGGCLNESLLKGMTGGDRQKGRHHYKDFFEFNPTAKIHLVGNHRPRITGRDDGIWRRFRLIDWSIKIPEEERDLKLDQKLQPEFPGILNWMIEGALALKERGTCPPECIRLATEKFREDSDSFGEFLTEATINDPDGVIYKADLYTLYKEYCDDQEIQKTFRFSKKKVGKLVFERGYDEGIIHGNVKIWRGLRARKPTD